MTQTAGWGTYLEGPIVRVGIVDKSIPAAQQHHIESSKWEQSRSGLWEAGSEETDLKVALSQRRTRESVAAVSQ